MSVSGPQASTSNPTSTSSQNSAQGASGANSPTVTGSNNTVVSSDPQVALSSIAGASSAVLAALNQTGSTANNAQNLAAQAAAANASQSQSQSNNDNALLSTILQQDAALATAQGTGGASLTTGSNNIVLYGAIGIAIAAVLAIAFGGHRK